MRPANSATLESLPETGSSKPQPSRRPLQIFSAIFVAAGFIYSYRLGADPLGASEAYSAWASAKSVGAIVRTPVLHDPGKQVFYYVVLHYYSNVFGLSEVSLRSLSVAFSLITLALVYALGCEMLDNNSALAASAMWAFNPLAVVFAQMARMYSMLIAVALLYLLTLWRVRAQPSIGRAVLCGITGAALLYTHLGGILFIGVGAAMLARDYIAGRRESMPWLALGITLALFAPYAPIARAQSETLVAGHWLDWIGTTYEFPLPIKILVAIAAAALALWFTFGTRKASARNDQFIWLGAWTILPALALAAGSIAIRPMFNLRYVAPSTAGLALLAAATGAWANVKWRNLLAAGFAVACLIVLPFDSSQPQPWRKIAEEIGRSGASQPVFFEAGFVTNGNSPNVPNGGFPFGYYSIPFDYYFKGDNPRIAVPGFDPASARSTIEERVTSSGGGWLISWKEGGAVDSELPDPKRFTSTETNRSDHLVVYRITPALK